jgi:hypothetical protein
MFHDFSESLYGIPLMVTFTRVASFPQTEFRCNPTPASDVVTTEGKIIHQDWNILTVSELDFSFFG